MSAYICMETQFTDKEMLQEALNSMGYPSTYHEKPVNLKDYVGKTRPEKAHIVIKRKHVGDASNEIGFLRQENGTFQAIVSEFDQSQNRLPENELKVRYAHKMALRDAEARGLKLVRQEKKEDGGVRMVFQPAVQVRG